jgi:hypothetical protein
MGNTPIVADDTPMNVDPPMDDTADVADTSDVAARWRLRYAAFLCAIFDGLLSILEEEGVSDRFEFVEQFETPTFLNDIIDRSTVSFLTPAKSWSTFSSRFAIGLGEKISLLIQDQSETKLYVHH